MNRAPCNSMFSLVRITATDADWTTEPPARLVWMAQQLLLIRCFEMKLLWLKDHDLINGPVHTSVGQEAVAVGAAAALTTSDQITGSHRAHHQYLAKVLNACAGGGFDPLNQGLSPAMTGAIRTLLAEIMGLAPGCCGGRGGSMHLFNAQAGVAGTNAIVAGGVPIATGTAWAHRYRGTDAITICFFGDGAVYQGVLHESANLAALLRAPVIYFIENNQYAVATSRRTACSARHLADIAAAYGMPALLVDGMDPLAVKLAVAEARRRKNEGGLPCFIEADTYRFYHHAGANPGSTYGYRTKEEEAAWQERDPVVQFLGRLKHLGLLDAAGEQRLNQQAEACVEQAVVSLTQVQADGVWVTRNELWPDPLNMRNGLRDEKVEANGPFVEAEDLPGQREIKYADAIAAVTGRWLEKDPMVVVLGEEVANFGGGAYGATKGLPAKYPGRVINTPITEAGFCGLACGAAMNGMHPVVELMFSSFGLVAADQLFNQIGQLGYIYGGHVDVPLVVRTRVAAGLGYGAQHSMDPVALFSLFPGWRIVVPATPCDYIGLFNAAMRARSPTLIVEHHELYGRKGKIPDDPLDFTIKLGRGKTLRAGKDVTVVAYGVMALRALEAARRLETEGVDAEVIDLRTVDDAGLDLALIGQSLMKTGALLTVEEAPRCNSIGAKIAAACVRRYYDYFDGPPGAVTGPDIPMPVSRRLEQACLPTLDQICDAMLKTAKRQA